MGNIRWINQISFRELQDGTDPTYLKHEQRTRELKDPHLLRCFGNTIITRVKSSKFNENSTYWHQYFLLRDIKGLMKRQGLSLEEAIRYCIRQGDVKLYCDCKSWLYWAYKYYATRDGYTYGGYREFRAPTRNNTEELSLLCKHADRAIRWLQAHEDTVIVYFREYYNRTLVQPRVAHEEPTTKPVRELPAQPQFVSKSSNENDVEVAYEDPDSDVVYIPTEQEKEEILEEEQEILEEADEAEEENDEETEEDSEEDSSVLDDTIIEDTSETDEGTV